MLNVERLEDRRLLSAWHVPILPAGSSDLAFGYEGGLALNNGGDFPGIRAFTPAAVEPDGKMLLLDGPVERFNTDGTLDTSFGDQGRASVPGAGFSSAVGQPDGKIVAAGTMLARFLSDGQLDPTFTTSVLQAAPLDLQLDASGDIFVLGNDCSIARYHSDGTLDSGFGVGGLLTVHPSDGAGAETVDAMAVQPDGGVVVATTGARSVIAQRFDARGQLDTTFGRDGSVRPDIPANLIDRTGLAHGYAPGKNQVAVQPDGRMVLSGTSPQGLWLEAFHPDGTLDLQFGRSGKTSIGWGDTETTAAVLFADGRIGFAVCTLERKLPLHESGFDYQTSWRVGRLTSGGKIDHSFPIRRLKIGGDSPAASVALLLTPDGNLLSSVDSFHLHEYLGRPTPAFARRTGDLVTAYVTQPTDQISISPADTTLAEHLTFASLPGLRVTVNGQSGIFFGKRIRIVWPGHGVLRHLPTSVSGTVQELFATYGH